MCPKIFQSISKTKSVSKPLLDRKVSQQKGRFCEIHIRKKLCQSKKSNTTPHALLGLENPGGIYASVTNQGLLSKKKF